jgi:curved DNA-binding protein CbpA/CheY-like chemotaxis protein
MSPPRILVLDTSSRNLRVIERCLRALGYDVCSVAEGERLKLELRAAPAACIVASADVSHGAGLDIVRDLYGQVALPLPVIAVSAVRTPAQLIAEAPVELLLGATLRAPLDPAELARAITALVPPPDPVLAARVLDDLVKDMGQVGARALRGSRLEPPEGEMRLEQTPMTVLLWAIHYNDWTGVLHVRDSPGGGVKLWCEFGQLVFARSNTGRDVVKTAVIQGRIKQSALPDVPLRNLQDETGLLMALRAIGMHEVDAIVQDTVLRLVQEALLLPAGLVEAIEGETWDEELNQPLSLPPLMAKALASRPSKLEDLHRNASLVARFPPGQVVAGWGFTGQHSTVLTLLQEVSRTQTSLDKFVEKAAGDDPERRAITLSMLDLLIDSGFLEMQGRAFDVGTERELGELVRLIHGAGRGTKFDALGLDVTATGAEIRAAGRELARKYHPDNYFDASPRVQATVSTLFGLLQEAYTTLKNPATREEYRRSVSSVSTTGETASMKGDPELAKVAVHKAKRLLEKKRYREAVAGFRDGTLHDPSSVDAQVLLGWARYLESGDPTVGTQELEKALRLDARSADAWFYLGRIANLQKDTTRAARRYRKALAFQPGHLEAQRELRLLERRGEESGRSSRESGGWGMGLLRRLAGKDDG